MSKRLCGLITVLVAVLAAPPAQADAVSFTDTFSPPSSEWTNTSGSWTASGGNYFAQVPNNNPGADTFLPLDLTSYTMSVTVNNLGDGGIFVRTNSTDTQWVLLILGGAGYGQGARGGAAGNSIYWADSSNPNALFGLTTGVFTPGNTYTITVTASGDTFSAFVNGSSTPISTFMDSVAGSDGGVGLYDDQPNTTTGSGSGPAQSFSDFSLQGTTPSTSGVPEPGTLALLLTGIGSLTALRKRMRRA